MVVIGNKIIEVEDGELICNEVTTNKKGKVIGADIHKITIPEELKEIIYAMDKDAENYRQAYQDMYKTYFLASEEKNEIIRLAYFGKQMEELMESNHEKYRYGCKGHKAYPSQKELKNSLEPLFEFHKDITREEIKRVFFNEPERAGDNQ